MNLYHLLSISFTRSSLINCYLELHLKLMKFSSLLIFLLSKFVARITMRFLLLSLVVFLFSSAFSVAAFDENPLPTALRVATLAAFVAGQQNVLKMFKKRHFVYAVFTWILGVWAFSKNFQFFSKHSWALREQSINSSSHAAFIAAHVYTYVCVDRWSTIFHDFWSNRKCCIYIDRQIFVFAFVNIYNLFIYLHYFSVKTEKPL